MNGWMNEWTWPHMNKNQEHLLQSQSVAMLLPCRTFCCWIRVSHSHVMAVIVSGLPICYSSFPRHFLFLVNRAARFEPTGITHNWSPGCLNRLHIIRLLGSLVPVNDSSQCWQLKIPYHSQVLFPTFSNSCYSFLLNTSFLKLSYNQGWPRDLPIKK